MADGVYRYGFAEEGGLGSPLSPMGSKMSFVLKRVLTAAMELDRLSLHG